MKEEEKRRLKRREAAASYRSVGLCKCDVDAQTRQGKAMQGRERDVRVESTSSFRSKGRVMMRGWPIATTQDSSPPRA
jgi:hypothetical protein